MDFFQLLEGTPLAWLLAYAPVVIAVCSVIDAVVPQPRPRSRWWRARKFISRLACNLGHARNASR